MKHLVDRRRNQEANHLRTTEVQILDALLRIEELLQKREEEPVAIAKKPTGGRKVDRL